MEIGKPTGDTSMDMADSGTGEEQGFRITNDEGPAGPANDIYQCPPAETTGSLESGMMEGFKSPKTSPMLAPEVKSDFTIVSRFCVSQIGQLTECL